MNTKTITQPSDKILNIPRYIFAELAEWVEEAKEKGIELIDLSIGNPDGPTPQPVIDATVKSLGDIKNHGYTDFKGKLEYRQAVSAWMKNRYGIELDPKSEVIVTSGAKEGLAHLALAYTNPGDLNIVPDPYYPVHSRGTWISDGNVFHIKLREENDFLPNFEEIPEDVAKKAKMFFVNYPNNPTAAIAPKSFYQDLVQYCKENELLICSDLAYGCINFDGYKAPSILEIEGAKDIAIEIHTFSKTFNMAGWRIGFAAGNKNMVESLYNIKSNIDYGTAAIIQDAAIEALNLPCSFIDDLNKKYARRRDIVVDGFNSLGWNIEQSKAAMFLWLPIPEGYTSKEWCKKILLETGILFTPGMAFGDESDRYFRVSLVQPDEKIKEAFERLKNAGFSYN